MRLELDQLPTITDSSDILTQPRQRNCKPSSIRCRKRREDARKSNQVNTTPEPNITTESFGIRIESEILEFQDKFQAENFNDETAQVTGNKNPPPRRKSSPWGKSSPKFDTF